MPGTTCAAAKTSDQKKVTITVNPVPPAAKDDSYGTNQSQPLTVPTPGVLANDTGPNGKTLTAVKVSDPSHGKVTLNPDGSFTYAPDANFNGTDTFTYKANDGTADSSPATVNIAVEPVSGPPGNPPTPLPPVSGLPVSGPPGNPSPPKGKHHKKHHHKKHHHKKHHHSHKKHKGGGASQ